MKKTLLLLTTLTCASLSACPFEDICRIEGIDEQFLRDGRPLDVRRGLWEDTVATNLMSYYYPQLKRLIPVADENNQEHERVIRKLINDSCYLARHVNVRSARIFNKFNNRQHSYAEFLEYVQKHLDELIPKKIDVRYSSIGHPYVTYHLRTNEDLAFVIDNSALLEEQP